MDNILTSQQEKYNKLVSSKDFKNKNHIFSTYNDSIRAYKRYRTAVESGRPNDACEELSNAANKLAAVVEWSAKYLVWTHYNQQILLHSEDPQVSSWQQFVRFKKIKHGTTYEVNMSTYDLLNIVLNTYPSQISSNQVRAMKDESIRKALINGYKHEGKVPDASAFLETNQEVYYFLKLFLVKDDDVNLLSLTDDYPNSWEELLISCSYFKPGRSKHYVLLTDCINDIEVVKNIFKIGWDMVLDFSLEDSDDQKKNLYDQYLGLDNKKSVILKYLCDIKARDTLPATSQTYWIKLNGKQNAVREKERILDDKALTRRYIMPKIPILLNSFSSEYTMPIELIVLGCSNYTFSTERLMLCLNDHYGNAEELTIHVMDCNNNFLSNATRAGHLFANPEMFKFYDLELQQLAKAIENNIGEYNEITSEVIQIPHSDVGTGIIDYNEYLAMQSVLELVYLGIEKEYTSENREQRGGDFLKGAVHADWDFVADDKYCIAQDSEQNIREEIIKRLKDKEKSIYSIDYEAGLGGTTFMRKMAYLLHDAYPTIIVTRYIEIMLIDFLLEIYKNSYKEIVLFVDSNDLSFNEVSKLQRELVQNSDFSFEIIYISRIEIGNRVNRHLSRMNYKQCLNMQQNLLRYTDNVTCIKHLDACVDKAKEHPMEEDHIPFVLSLYAFDENFIGIQDFVKHSLDSLSEKELDIIFVLALADFANYKVDAQYFCSCYGKATTQYMKRDDSALAPLIKYTRDNTQKKERFHIRYSLFTNHILQHFSEKSSIRFTALLDRIIKMIQDSRGDEYSEENAEIIKLLNKLFIERKDTQDEDTDAKGVYSPLITRLISENKSQNANVYNDSKEVIIKIFQCLVNTYPDQPHFAGHLARYYFYTTKSYDIGFGSIDDAIDAASGIEGYAMGSLYHIKAMGFVSRINYEYLQKIRDSMNHYKRTSSIADINTIEKCIHSIREDLVNAVRYFDKARSEENSRFISNIAECRLNLSVQSQFDNLKEFCADNSLDSFVSDAEQIDLYDRIDNLIEDCENLLTGGKGTINNYNTNLLEKIKQSKELTKANGDEVRAVCRQIISEGSSEMARIARRKLARIQYNDVLKDPSNSENQSALKEIVSMMEDNFDEDSSTNANFRIWFKALRAIDVNDLDVINELEDTLLKLEKWTEEPNASVDAFYYKYIVKFILAFEEGTLDGNADVREELSQMLQDLTNSSEKIPKRTIPFEWFSGYHRGLRRLISSADLNELGKADAIKTLHLFRGELPGKESFQTRQAYISLKQLPVYFNPQSISDRITATSENQYVDFGLGFSYSGLRTYHDSIQIHKGKPIKKAVKILTEGMEVTAEVTSCTDSYIITTIQESGGKRCDLQYHQLEPLGYDKNNRPPKQEQFRIKLLKSITLKNGQNVWKADLIIPRNEYTKNHNIAYYPFANIGDFWSDEKDV